MRNIPDFTCEYGAAQLILEEVPRTGRAYCLVQWAAPGKLKELLAEAARFCRMVDAGQVLALAELFGPEGAEAETAYPEAFQVVRMQAEKDALPPARAALWPLLAEQWEDYSQRHNRAMSGVDGARQLSGRDRERMLDQGGCYFVHRDGQLLGLGQVSGNEIRTLISCVPGAGAEVLAALAQAVWEDTVCVSVATTNARALRLYEWLGFVTAGVTEHWVQIAAWQD